MGANTRVCRVCGKEYEGCKTPRITGTNFNWREVACSYECGQEYLLRIMISREKNNATEPVAEPVIEEPVEEILEVEESEVEEVAEDEDFEDEPYL